MYKIQKPITVTLVLLKVTTCLYLSPSNNARSLSTLIAVKQTLHTKYNLRKLLSEVNNSKYPIFLSQQKSNLSHTKAPQWYQYRDQLTLCWDTGVWTTDEVRFPCHGRATRIRVFRPRNAVMERKIFMAERKVSSLSTPLINSAEQNSSMNVFWFSSSVTFVWAIFICDEMRCKWGLFINIALLIWRKVIWFAQVYQYIYLFISFLDSLSVPYFSVIDETRFPVYVRALSCHLRIALSNWVESDIDVDSHIIFNTLIHSFFFFL